MATKVTYQWILASVKIVGAKEQWGYQKEVLDADGNLVRGADAIYGDSIAQIISDMGTGFVTYPISPITVSGVRGFQTFRLVLERTQTTDIPYSWKGEQRERNLYAHVDEYGKLDDFFQKDQFGDYEKTKHQGWTVNIKGPQVPQKFHKELRANKDAQMFGDFGKAFKNTHGAVHGFMSGKRHCRRCEGLMLTSPFLASDEAPKMEIKSLKSQPYNSRLGTRYAMVATCTNSQCDNKEYIQDPQQHWNRRYELLKCLTCVK
jgi:hypothetical protein